MPASLAGISFFIGKPLLGFNFTIDAKIFQASHIASKGLYGSIKCNQDDCQCIVYPIGSPIFHHTKEAVFVPNLVLIEQAVKESGYDKNYIGFLARKGFIKGEKHGGTWLIELDSLKEYEAQMKKVGTKKFDPTKYKKDSE